MPKPCNHPYKPSEPEIVVNEATGKQSMGYFISADLEISFCKEVDSEQKLKDGQMLNEECFGTTMSACISSLMEPSIYDTDEIRELKTHFFPPIVTSGEFAIYDVIVQLMDQCHAAKKNLTIITNHYQHCRLTDIEREIAQQTTKCQNPICNYTFLERSEMVLDHDHLGTEGYKGGCQKCQGCQGGQECQDPNAYKGHGGGLRRCLCQKCNANIYRLNKDMVFFFHFGSRFDFGFLIRTIANAISAGDHRFRDLKLLSKDSACQYLTWSFKYCCFDCLSQIGAKDSCEHSFKKYVFKDSYSILPSKLATLIDVSVQPLLQKQATFAECFPLFADFLQKNRYLEFITESDIISKGCIPYLSVQANEDGQKFLKSTEFIERSEWKLTRFDDADDNNIIDQKTYDKVYQLWNNMKRYEAEINKRPLIWDFFIQFYCLTDTYFLSCILKKYMVETFHETGRFPGSFLSLASISFRRFLDVAKQEKMPVLSQYNLKMFEWLETKICGGLSYGNFTRINEANADFLPNFNPKKPESFHLIIDQNSQYSNAMENFSHPYSSMTLNSKSECRRVCEEINNGSWKFWDDNFTKIAKNQNGDLCEFQQIFVVDLRLDKKFHDKLKALPVCWVRKYPRRSWMSTNTRKLMNYMQKGKYVDDDVIYDVEGDTTIDFNETTENTQDVSQLRLLPVLSHVLNYPVSHRYLMLLLKLGYELVEIKEMATFESKPIFKKYIGDIIQDRQKTTCEVKKHRRKLEVRFIFLVLTFVFGLCSSKKT